MEETKKTFTFTARNGKQWKTSFKKDRDGDFSQRGATAEKTRCCGCVTKEATNSKEWGECSSFEAFGGTFTFFFSSRSGHEATFTAK